MKELSNKLFLIGSIFWACETLYFIIMYGWHLSAINKQEKMCDDIVMIIWGIAIILWLVWFKDKIEQFFN